MTEAMSTGGTFRDDLGVSCPLSNCRRRSVWVTPAMVCSSTLQGHTLRLSMRGRNDTYVSIGLLMKQTNTIQQIVNKKYLSSERAARNVHLRPHLATSQVVDGAHLPFSVSD